MVVVVVVCVGRFVSAGGVVVEHYVVHHDECDYKDGRTEKRAVQTLRQRDSNP